MQKLKIGIEKEIDDDKLRVSDIIRRCEACAGGTVKVFVGRG
jgi:hypothetical protein